MPRKILKGKVISDKNKKTIVVLVERKYQHPLLKKIVRNKKKYHAHDEKNIFKLIDISSVVKLPAALCKGLIFL
mgnify:CR=1 FL=1